MSSSSCYFTISCLSGLHAVPYIFVGLGVHLLYLYGIVNSQEPTVQSAQLRLLLLNQLIILALRTVYGFRVNTFPTWLNHAASFYWSLNDIWQNMLIWLGFKHPSLLLVTDLLLFKTYMKILPSRRLRFSKSYFLNVVVLCILSFSLIQHNIILLYTRSLPSLLSKVSSIRFNKHVTFSENWNNVSTFKRIIAFHSKAIIALLKVLSWF